MIDQREPGDEQDLRDGLKGMGFDLGVREEVEVFYASGGPFHALVVDLTDGGMALWLGFCTALGAVLAKKASDKLSRIFKRRHVHLKKGEVAAIITMDVPPEAIQELGDGLPDAPSGTVVWDPKTEQWRDRGH